MFTLKRKIAVLSKTLDIHLLQSAGLQTQALLLLTRWPNSPVWSTHTGGLEAALIRTSDQNVN